MRRTIAAAAIAVCLSLASGPARAQADPATPGPDSQATFAPDPAVVELGMRVPTELAGLSLAEHLQWATGEELLSVMQPEEMALITQLLDGHERSIGDLTGASAWQLTDDGELFVIQAYRIAGLDAAGIIDAWIEIVSLGFGEPQASEVVIAGRSITLLTEAADPRIRTLYLLPDRDVMWLIVGPDEALVMEAIDAVTGQEATVTQVGD